MYGMGVGMAVGMYGMGVGVGGMGVGMYGMGVGVGGCLHWPGRTPRPTPLQCLAPAPRQRLR